jgi:hypothetical protein
MLYITLTSFLFILQFIVAQGSPARKYFYAFSIIALFAFSAFRFKVGCDWSGYYHQYKIADVVDWSEISIIREPIWWYILAWIKFLDLPYPAVNVVSSAIFFLGIHCLARRQPDPLGFLLLLFPILILNMPMSGIRQGAAIGLICVAFAAFIDRSALRYASWVLLAAGFHSSALIFMVLLPVASGRYTRKRLYLSVIIALPGAFFLMLSAAADIAIRRYVGTGVEAAGALFRLSILGISSIYFLVLVRKRWFLYWPKDYSLVSIGAIGMLLAPLLLSVSTVIGDRLGYYFIPVQSMIFARLPFLKFSKNSTMHITLPYFLIFIVFLVWSQLSSHFETCYLPYKTWILGFPHGDSVGM